jgi:hypothetical protein
MNVTDDLSPAILRRQAEAMLVVSKNLDTPLQIGLLMVAVRLYLVLADRWEKGKINRQTVDDEIAIFLDRFHRYTKATVTEQRESAIMGVIQQAARLEVCHVWLLTGKNKDEP